MRTLTVAELDRVSGGFFEGKPSKPDPKPSKPRQEDFPEEDTRGPFERLGDGVDDFLDSPGSYIGRALDWYGNNAPGVNSPMGGADWSMLAPQPAEEGEAEPGGKT